MTDQPSPAPSRVRIFILLSVACVLLAAGYVAWSRQRALSSSADIPVAPSSDPAAFQAASAAPHLLFRSMVVGDDYGHVAAVPLAAPQDTRAAALARCDRLYTGGERTICVSSDFGFGGKILGPDMQELFSFPLGGMPSRARVSPDGRYAATTSFVSGHSYAEASFSTETLLIDVASQQVLANLEAFTVLRDGQPFRSEDFNFWGVTFTKDSSHFYATLASKGTTYLVRGDIAARTVEVLRTNVECPSISPDNTRLVFKKQVQQAGSPVWRLHVLDLATMAETPLAEARSIDDQVEWLDDGRILYEVRGPDTTGDLWVVPADGSGAAQLFLARATSPVVIR